MNNLEKYITKVESQEQADNLLQELKKIDNNFKYHDHYAKVGKDKYFFGIDQYEVYKKKDVSIVSEDCSYFEERQLISYNEFMQKIKENQKNLNLSNEEIFVLKCLMGVLPTSRIKNILGEDMGMNKRKKQAAISFLGQKPKFADILHEKLEKYIEQNNITLENKQFKFSNGNIAEFLGNNYIKIGCKKKKYDEWARIIELMLDLTDDHVIIDSKRYNRQELIEFKKTIENL